MVFSSRKGGSVGIIGIHAALIHPSSGHQGHSARSGSFMKLKLKEMKPPRAHLKSLEMLP